jgi:hypothetical protein
MMEAASRTRRLFLVAPTVNTERRVASTRLSLARSALTEIEIKALGPAQRPVGNGYCGRYVGLSDNGGPLSEMTFASPIACTYNGTRKETPNDRILVRVPDLHRRRRIWALARLAGSSGVHQHRPKFGGYRRDIPQYQNESLIGEGRMGYMERSDSWVVTAGVVFSKRSIGGVSFH